MTYTIATTAEVSEEFCRDVLTGALEGGIGYWSQVNNVDHKIDRDDKHNITRAVIHPLTDDETAYDTSKAFVLDSVLVATGLGKVLSQGFNIGSTLRGAIQAAVVNNDACYLDADAADVIIQAAIFGEIVYG